MISVIPYRPVHMELMAQYLRSSEFIFEYKELGGFTAMHDNKPIASFGFKPMGCAWEAWIACTWLAHKHVFGLAKSLKRVLKIMLEEVDCIYATGYSGDHKAIRLINFLGFEKVEECEDGIWRYLKWADLPVRN